MFGYKPLSLEDFERIRSVQFRIRSENVRRTSQGGHIVDFRTEPRSEACLVIRHATFLVWGMSSFHASFELYGKEYNFGPGTRKEFPIEQRFPLHRNYSLTISGQNIQYASVPTT